MNASQMEAEKDQATLRSAEATVLQAQAAVEQAAITYSYTHVFAPFDGIVSAHMADLGALVGGSSPTQLATITQLDPI